jgi:hypothetical protein
VAAPGSISTACDTSRCMRPNRSNGASILPPSKTEGSPNAFLAIDNALLKVLMVWKLAGKKMSRLFQEAQEGKSLGVGEAFGYISTINIINIFLTKLTH